MALRRVLSMEAVFVAILPVENYVPLVLWWRMFST